MLKKIYDVLNGAGIDVYFPGVHEGDCVSPYVVVKSGGTMSLISVSSERPLYTIMCYVPADMYSSLEILRDLVKNEIKKLYPAVEYAGNETQSFYDEDVKGHMISFQCQGIRKLSNF